MAPFTRQRSWVSASALNVAVPAKALDASNDRAAVDRAELASGSKRILVIDDNSDNSTLLSRVLHALGHTPLTAATGAEGLSAALRERPDLVLLDIVLPGMDGYQVLRLMKTSPELAGTPIVAVTALTSPGHATRALEAGFDGYLQKPIDVERLAELIGRLCVSR